VADVKWIKITTDIFDDEKILLIESLPEADSIIVIWFKLLCLAGKMNNSGVFMMNDKIAYTDKMLATIFRRKETTVQLALQTFENFGMVEIIDGVITIPNWNKHQSLDVLEKKREYQKELMRKRRAEQKLLCKANGDTNSKANVSRVEREEEREEDKKENKSVRETTRTIFQRLLPDYVLSDLLAEKMAEWIIYKTERKEPYKEQGMKSLLRQVENNSMKYGDQAVCNLIEECMANNWKGIIFDRLQSQRKPASGGYQRQTKAEELDDFYKMAAEWSES
jgi:predicted phage replisome organizer